MTTSSWLPKVQGIVIFSIALLIIFTRFVYIPGLDEIILFSCLLMILILFPDLNRKTQIVCILMLCVGNVLFFMYNLDFVIWVEALSLNLGLISLFAFVPLLMLPIQEGGYLTSIKHMLTQRQHKSNTIFFLLSSLTFLIGSIVNLVVLRTLYPLFKGTSLSKKRFYSAMLIGFTCTNIWSPYFASVVLILHFLNLPYSSLGPWLLGLALLQFTLGNILALLGMKTKSKISTKTSIELEASLESSVKHSKKVFQLVFIMTLIFFGLFLLEKISQVKMTTLVSLAGLLVSTLWLLLLGEGKRFKKHGLNYVSITLPKIGNEVSLFLSAGFLGIIVMHTPFGELLASTIKALADSLPPIVLITSLLITPFVLAMLGIHQIIPVTILATSVPSHVIGLSPIAYGVLLAAAWCHASMASPFSPVNITLGNVLHCSSIDAGFKGNFIFFIGAVSISVLMVFYLS